MGDLGLGEIDDRDKTAHPGLPQALGRGGMLPVREAGVQDREGDRAQVWQHQDFAGIKPAELAGVDQDK